MGVMYRIVPLFAERIWGGTKLRDNFNFDPDKDPCGEAWVVANVPLGTSWVEGIEMPLDEFYQKYREEYFGINEPEFPIRITVLDAGDDLSVQLHPTHEYAMEHEGTQGKPEAWYVIDSDPGGKIQFGHTAKTKEEFIDKALNNKWEELLSFVDAQPEKFLYVDAGVLHAVGRGVVCYEIARNADITYRVYDYDRLDKKTGKPRELHLQKAFDNIRVPFNEVGMIKLEEIWNNGIGVIEYHNIPKQFTLRRLRCVDEGTYSQPEFAFYTVGKGSGTINGIEVLPGDTYFLGKDFGEVKITGDLDILAGSYRE